MKVQYPQADIPTVTLLHNQESRSPKFPGLPAELAANKIMLQGNYKKTAVSKILLDCGMLFFFAFANSYTLIFNTRTCLTNKDQ